MFNLDKALASWRRNLANNHAFSADDLDELEQHVRDQVAALCRRGLSDKEAFRTAVHEMGEYGTAEREYRKVYWGKLRRRRQLLHEFMGSVSMLANYLKIAYRNLRKHKGYAFINITGLAVGIACCLFIALYVYHEGHYDRYHENADRIYRLTTRDWAKMPPAVGPALRGTYAHLAEQTVRFWPLFASAKVRRDDVVFVESGGVFADPNVFSVFSWPLVAGDPAEALAVPNTMVLTRSMAEKYFGTADPLGATLQFWGREMTVTGLLEDVPLNAHFRFDFLVSFSSLYTVMGDRLDEEWGLPAFYTYVLARPGVAPATIAHAAEQLFADHQVQADTPPLLQPLRQIYLYSDLQGEIGPTGNVAYLYMLGTAALLVLLLACVNFTNLITARAATRTREIGMRKVLGAQRRQLVVQFFGETVLMSAAALLVALLLVGLAFPAFNQLAGKIITFPHIASPKLVIGLVSFVLLVSLVAGSYPAFFLSRFKPIRVLKGAGGIRMSNLLLRKGLVVFQFTVSTALTIGVAVVFLQLSYLQHKDLGFDKEHVVVLDGDRFPLVREALRTVPGVDHVAGAPLVLGDLLPSNPYKAEGAVTDSTSQMLTLGATPGFIETMEMRIVAGRPFVEGSVLDENEGFVLNESAVRTLGWSSPAEAVGKSFSLFVPPLDGGAEVWREGHVVGVVQDFHHDALYQRIAPVVLYPSHDLNLTFVHVRQVSAGMLAAIKDVWQEVNPDAPFNYYLLDDHLRQQYQAEQRLSGIMGTATGLAILIACLGLFGLAAFTVEQQTKEIGVCKVLGASVGQIITLLSGHFVRLVGLAAVLAVPVSYVAMTRWLAHFAYHIELSWLPFLLVGLLTLVMALLTVSYKAVKAALADPVNSLRYE